jgi:RNA polymerase sigma-70 factor (ECF subfamily)
MSEASLDESRDNSPDVTIESLIRKHYVVLYRYAYRLTGQQCDAEDLTQQTFLTAHRSLHQLRDVTAVQGWLFQILRTSFVKVCRKRQPQSEIDAEFAINEVAATVENDMAFDVEHMQLRLNELPDTYRIALLMFYFEGKSYDQIATELDVALGTVMSRLSRAKAHLRARIGSVEAMN